VSSELRTLTPSIAECREELRAVLASRVFQQSQRLALLLQYICSKAVLGEAEQVTEYTIAVDVFGKPQGFRESKDSIVRVEVHRLRKRLAAFYAQEGAGRRVRILIPPGSYVPDFKVYQAPEPGTALSGEPAESGAVTGSAVGNGAAVGPAGRNQTRNSYPNLPESPAGPCSSRRWWRRRLLLLPAPSG